jgi:hypothetical protein
MDVLCKICTATAALKRSEEKAESSGQRNQERIIGNKLAFNLLGILVYNILTKHMKVLCKVFDASPADESKEYSGQKNQEKNLIPGN